MNDKILFVDDDPSLLSAVERRLRLRFKIATATGGVAGLAKMASDGPFAIIVADMQMPGMNGVQLLSEVQKRFPDTVRLMLTGNADQGTAAEAVNAGHVFEFLTKPCPTETLTLALQTGLRHHHLITAERELLERTLNGSVKVLADILSLADPLAFGRGESLRDYMRAFVKSASLANSWELEIAAMLSQIGLVTIPPAVIEKFRAGQKLTPLEHEVLDLTPKAGADLLANIPRLESVGRIVLYQRKHYDGSGFPSNAVRGEEIPMGARILKVLIDLLELEAQRIPKDTALSLMQKRLGWYDPRVLDTTFACFEIYLPDTSIKSLGRTVAVRDLRVGDVVLSDIQTESGKVLVLARSRLTPVLLMRLGNFARFSPIREPIYIEPDASATAV
ncbi:MAG: response regulator [Negativicutes bacterium]|nr:response regulator [Negativicutes bacterium]